MTGQQMIVLVLVAAAGVYLGRYLWGSLRAMWNSKSGCASGCGKCAYATQNFKGKPAASRPASPNIIPLTDVRSLPRRKKLEKL